MTQRLTDKQLADLQKQAIESAGENPDPHGKMHDIADATLSIVYDEYDGHWRINYMLPRGEVIGINSRMSVQQIKAQIRGMMADFAARWKG